MKVVGCLSWFDEPPEVLYDAVASHAAVCDEVVALDGRYRLFRHPRDVSRPEEYDAIHEACRDHGITATTVTPAEPWDGKWGGEVAKRAELFRLALERTTEQDWLWVFDGDVFLEHAVDDWREQLQATERHVAKVELDDGVTGRRLPHSTIFRALRGLTVSEHHWHYHAPGVVLWDYEELCTPALDLGELVAIAHRPDGRDADRLAARKRYYRDRDRKRIERSTDGRRRREINAARRKQRERLDALVGEVFAAAGAQPTS